VSPDLNGDGLSDLVIAETDDLLERRRAYVLFGSRTLPTSIDLQEISWSRAGIELHAVGLMRT